MEAFEVTQALMTVGTVYHVRRPQASPTLYTVRGELVAASPKFHLVEGDAGRAMADLTGNFIKTKYDVQVDGKPLATVVFPTVAFKKTLTLTIGDDEYTADGGVFKGVFHFRKAASAVVLEIAKELSIRDRFLVKSHDVLPLEVALLSAVAIHSRFYELV